MAASRAIEWIRRRYPWLLVAVDLAALAVGFVASGLGWNAISKIPVNWSSLLATAAISAALFLAFGHGLHLYRARYTTATFDEVAILGVGWFGAGAIALLVNIVVFDPRVPTSVLGLAMLLGGATMLGTRGVWRVLVRAAERPDPDGRTKVVVFGAGSGAEMVVRSMLSDPRSQYVPVAILDDAGNQQNRRIEGLRVSGTRDAIPELVDHADALLIAIPSASSLLVAELSDLAEQAGLEVIVLPNTTELIGLMATHDTIRPLEPADLLGREEVSIDEEAVAGYLEGRTVLVTGAGGSIGSELCRQILIYGPERLVMVDRDETALQTVQLSIAGHGLLDDENLVLADIRDRDGIFEVFERFDPQIVFHAAALKHLPMLEARPREALLTNVVGTMNVLDAAASVGVDHFVNVSTDKAANPISVLGTSKRLAEGLTVETGLESSGQYVSVRFGNVLGSRGSVLPVFEAQIEAGQPLQLTDPEVTRFFMTVPEASKLVLQAGAIGKTGETLVLDMGEPVKILDLAHKLLKHRKSEVDVVICGLRENEKLHEELSHDGELMVSREHPRVWHTDTRVCDVRRHLESLAAIGGQARDDLRLRMLELSTGEHGSSGPAIEDPAGARPGSSAGDAD